VVSGGVEIDSKEFAYPSTNTDIRQKQYFWSALCRQVDLSSNVQVTVFVSRRTSPNLEYPAPDGSGVVGWPRPVKVEVSGTAGNNELTITGEKTFINDGCTIVDDQTGRLYRVLQRYADNDDVILLEEDWQGSDAVWLVPPPTTGGRYPCIAIYQTVIRF